MITHNYNDDYLFARVVDEDVHRITALEDTRPVHREQAARVCRDDLHHELDRRVGVGHLCRTRGKGVWGKGDLRNMSGGKASGGKTSVKVLLGNDVCGKEPRRRACA